MKKIELIWREILTKALEDRTTSFSQKTLAHHFSISTSTVFHALKKPKACGAITVGGRGFELVDFEKLLFLWATERKFSKEVMYQTQAEIPIFQIEGSMPHGVIPTAYTAYRFLFNDAPADYDVVYFYASTADEIARRFPKSKKGKLIVILEADPFLSTYHPAPPLVQLFADIWNLPQWYAKEYHTALLEKIHTKMGM